MEKFNVRLEITNYCNLKCPHCTRVRTKESYNLNSKHVSLQTVKKWLPIYILIESIENIFLSGAVGEPSLNPELIKIVNYLSKYTNIQIDSNGSTNNEDWWKELGSYGIDCVFSPDSLVKNNNHYRINSNTDKVISNMKAFISGGGKASWKYIPFMHNENELEDQKRMAKQIGAKFLIVQPASFDANREGETMKPSKYFPHSQEIMKSNTKGQSPEYYCDIIGKLKNLIEISPDGVIYPCCYLVTFFFLTYADFFNNDDPKPKIIEENMIPGTKYYEFVNNMLPLIENQGGIKTFSLNHNTLEQILETDFYKFSLRKSWQSGNKFCEQFCQSKTYIFSET